MLAKTHSRYVITTYVHGATHRHVYESLRAAERAAAKIYAKTGVIVGIEKI